MAYSAKSQKEYNEKCKVLRVKYTPNDLLEYNRLQYYINNSSLTVTEYVKQLIKTDLDNKGILYEQKEQNKRQSN